MPLLPGERYSEMEIKILELLKDTPGRQGVYELMRQNLDYKPRYLLALQDLTVLDFKLYSEFNHIEVFKGKLKMADLMGTGRDLMMEKTNPFPLYPDAIKFCLAILAYSQDAISRTSTIVFSLNTCGLDAEDLERDDYATMKENFKDFVKENEPEDFFWKHYVLIPVYDDEHVYLTLVVRPMGCVLYAPNCRLGECKMVHLGTGDLKAYQEKYVPRILKLLELFMLHHQRSGEYLRILPDTVEHMEYKLPECAKWDRAWVVLYTIQQLVDLDKDIRKWKETFETIEEGKRQVFKGMNVLRKKLDFNMRSKISQSEDKVAKHIYQQRCSIIMHVERDNEAAKKPGSPAICDVSDDEVPDNQDEHPADQEDARSESRKRNMDGGSDGNDENQEKIDGEPSDKRQKCDEEEMDADDEEEEDEEEEVHNDINLESEESEFESEFD